MSYQQELANKVNFGGRKPNSLILWSNKEYYQNKT